MKHFIKKNIKIMVGIIIGIILTGISAYAATIIDSKNVLYDNTTSGLDSTNVQEAINEVYKKADIRNYENIVSAYTYNSTTCVTGEENTCVKTDCYKSTTAGSCKAGDIIKYKVNDTDIVTFHVMYDNGTTLTMQSQKNIVYSTPWISKLEYAAENTDGTSCNYSSCADEGPLTILTTLEAATAGWTNVNDQTYTLGTTTFKTNAFTGCDAISCTSNFYTLPSRTAKARLISLQEAVDFGCVGSEKSCPIWMYNFLAKSTDYGGTVNDTSTSVSGSDNYGYWTSSVYSSATHYSWYIYYGGRQALGNTYGSIIGARAVVVVSK